MTSHIKILNDKLLIGRSEWCALPLLNIPIIRAKVDTGAKTSALHAFDIETKKVRNKWFVVFKIHPVSNNNTITLSCRAEIQDERDIMSSNGHKERRFVIETKLVIGGVAWPIEMTLSNRDPLRYRMLLGREALGGRVLIDPSLADNQAKNTNKKVIALYNGLL